MTPRHEIVAVSQSTKADELETLVVATGHSRFPVYDGDLDHLIGYVHAKTLLDITQTDRRSPLGDGAIRPLLVLRATDRLRAVLLAMRQGRTHIALITDNTGQTAGLITLEDVLGRLVGPVRDERAPSIASQAHPPPNETLDTTA